MLGSDLIYNFTQVERWCGGQDLNLRTNKEWDLNPPPLTKLGDPRASLAYQNTHMNTTVE